MKRRILIIGVSGMLGNGLLYGLKKYTDLEVYCSIRDRQLSYFGDKDIKKIIPYIDIENWDSMINLFNIVKPDVVLNCVGLIKQVMGKNDTELAIYMNATFPHRLATLCELSRARLIHFSTDCVYSGVKGNYVESDPSDAPDVYGKTKYLGELNYDHTVTVRTSIIGHGLESHSSLIDWFLLQKGKIKGFSQVIYSGLPTVEHARIIAEYIIPNSKLKGLYHVSAEPISKYDLLKLISEIYGKKIKIEPYGKKVSDMSLDSSRFRKITGYKPPSWPNLIRKMHRYYQSNNHFVKY